MEFFCLFSLAPSFTSWMALFALFVLFAKIFMSIYRDWCVVWRSFNPPKHTAPPTSFFPLFLSFFVSSSCSAFLVLFPFFLFYSSLFLSSFSPLQLFFSSLSFCLIFLIDLVFCVYLRMHVRACLATLYLSDDNINFGFKCVVKHMKNYILDICLTRKWIKWNKFEIYKNSCVWVHRTDIR